MGMFTAETPAFLITIDTEGDNLWHSPREVTTKNAAFVPRFQSLCERWGFKPTYLVDYDMARSREFQEFGCDAIRRSTAEIGMHLHAWSTPPEFELTGNDTACRPYLIEYPEAVLRDKVALMTDLLEQTFGVPMRSHRAGRWAFNETYAKALIDQGYWVDCSVTPHITWKNNYGNPAGEGGIDYRDFPEHAYFVDPDEIGRVGCSPLLEIPMTIRPCKSGLIRRIRRRFGEQAIVSRALNRLVPAHTWFRPRRKKNLVDMLEILGWVKRKKIDYVEFMLHSSEFMPGGSPWLRNESDIDALYESLEIVFQAATSAQFRGATLAEYYLQYKHENLRR